MTRRRFRTATAVLLGAASLFGGAAGAVLAICGPFTDVAADVFCPFVLEIFYLGITTGTTATTYDPAANVSRLQMAAFLSRTVDGALRRGSRRAALDQFWTSQSSTALGLTTVGAGPRLLRSDGADVWVPNSTAGTVSRVRGSDGRLLETWTGATNATAALAAMGSVLVAANINPGRVYRIDPTQAAGVVNTVSRGLGGDAESSAFDGARIWTANFDGSASIVTPGASIPWTVTTVTMPPISILSGILYDGANIWVTDRNKGELLKLDSAGAVLQTVTLASFVNHPVFDGANIWVPDEFTVSVYVVRASTGAVLTTLTGNGMLSLPTEAAFDGQRILVTDPGANRVSLWKAADFTPLGFVATGASTGPLGVCSDGIHFWVSLYDASEL